MVVDTAARRDRRRLSQRGGNGGHRPARPADSISIAVAIRVVDGPLVSVRGVRPPDLAYSGPAESLLPLWIAPRSHVRAILDGVTLADVAASDLPADVSVLTDVPDAWTDPSSQGRSGPVVGEFPGDSRIRSR
ncbi:RrF2 family transcriptional regulator [Streptomyces sp. NRRL F-4428]|uniref:RrF2 family transcriptional regulator n=1 Tax=Streptomyces sp. NRRL F-4428 TaxID=1609137 RepID=UPI001F46B780|nr:Rrf2 family transcriptional regulator [Streptomyces sp. NRRL F-4428]